MVVLRCVLKMTTEVIQYDYRKYSDRKKIGQTNQSSVYQALRVSDSRKIILKCIVKETLGKSSLRNGIPLEYSILKTLDHPRIPKVYSLEEKTYDDEDVFYISMEFVRDKTLGHFLVNNRLSVEKSVHILKQILDILKYLFKNGIVHRDIKLQNIMIDENLNVSLIDFGFATYQESYSPSLNLLCGSPRSIAPEILRRKVYDGRKSDLWSVGVVFYTLLFRKFPFRSKDSDELKAKIINSSPFSEDLEKQVPKSCLSLLKALLSKNPENRPRLKKVLDSDCLKEYGGKYLPTP